LSRRIPAVDRKINEIRLEDRRVRIVGMVIESRPGMCILDDGSGSIKVRTSHELHAGKLIRVIGQVSIRTNGEIEIDAELIQDMDKLKFDLYKEVYSLKKKFKNVQAKHIEEG